MSAPEDRELLEKVAAAKGWGGPRDFDPRTGWNPLEQNDAAATLLVQFDIDLDMGTSGCIMAGRWALADGHFSATVRVADDAGDDARLAAWRRAVVMAVAAIVL